MSQLRLQLIGPPMVDVDGSPVKVDTRKAIALLAYLALEGGVQQRDGLAALLWPESDQSHARAALRRTLSTLRKGVGDDWVEADRETIALVFSPDLWVDVAEFEARIKEAKAHGHPRGRSCPECKALYQAAVQLYRDDFMAGFSLRDSPAFDDWQFYRGQSLRRAFGGALEALVRAGELARNYDEAIEYGRRWVAMDALHEPAHQHLIKLYAWSGQRGAALRQYQECVRALREELAVAPLEETTRIYERVRAGDLPAPAAPAALPRQAAGAALSDGEGEQGGPRDAAELPFVGRQGQLSGLSEAYRSIRGSGRLAVIEGEPGVGKSRLAAEFLERVVSAGARSVRVQAYEGEHDMAYAPLVEAVRILANSSSGRGAWADLSGAWLAEAARLAPEISNLASDVPAPPPMDTPGAVSRFYEGLVQVFMALSRPGAPGVLFIDDLHWADDGTANWLAYLARRLKDQPLFVLTAHRNQDLPAFGGIQGVLVEAQRASLLHRIRLGRLRQADVAELVRLTGDDSESLPHGERMYRETEGLPLFLNEYLGAIGRHELGWEEPKWQLPGGVRDLLRARVHSLTETAFQLLSSAAVIGRSFEYEILLQVSGRGEEETILGLEELSEKGFIRRLSGNPENPIYDFSHGKIRDLVRDETSPPRERLLHKRIADALVHRPSRPGHAAPAALIAGHYQAGGQRALAADYYFQAGEHAADLYANSQAVDHFSQALALGYPDHGGIHSRLADLYKLGGAYQEAIQEYHAAAAYSSAAQLARVEHKLGQVHHLLGDWQVAAGHYEAAQELLPKDDFTGRAKLYADWSLTQLQIAGEQAAMTLAGRASDLAARAGESQALTVCRNLMGLLERRSGELDRARAALQESLAMAESLGDPALEMAASNNLALVLKDQGQYERAVELLTRAVDHAVSTGDRHHEAALRGNLADVLYEAERREESMAELKRAAVIFTEIGEEAGEQQAEIWKLTQW